jgi:hypothetical protein
MAPMDGSGLHEDLQDFVPHPYSRDCGRLTPHPTVFYPSLCSKQDRFAGPFLATISRQDVSGCPNLSVPSIMFCAWLPFFSSASLRSR